MKRRTRALCTALFMLMTAALLTGCTEEMKNSKVESIVVTETADSLEYLESYANLQSADLRGYQNYDEIMAYIEAHPDVDVIYEIVIGGQTFANDAVELTMEPRSTEFNSILNHLKYLPGITHVSLPETGMTLDQIDQLQAAYPNVTFSYTVSLLDQVLDPGVTTLDLSAMSSDQISQVVTSLALLPDLTDVNLMAEDGTSSLTLTDVAQLQDAQPGAFFNYSFDLYGKLVSTADETIEYNEVNIGNEGEATIRQALDILDNCTYFKLDDCGLDNEIMASIREDYPDKKIVWRVRIPPYSMLTDETMLRLTHHLDNSKIEDLKYLNDVTYLDVGHNETLTDMSFVQYMPKLECVIISGSNVVDVTPFANCPNLIWLEMAFCYKIEDISFLKDHPTLKYLNISFSDVSDLSALENVDLDRFNCMGTNVSVEERDAFIEKHPDCLSIWQGKQPYGYGWRYNDYGYTFFEYYANMRIVFRYDDLSYWGNHKE